MNITLTNRTDNEIVGNASFLTVPRTFLKENPELVGKVFTTDVGIISFGTFGDRMPNRDMEPMYFRPSTPLQPGDNEFEVALGELDEDSEINPVFHPWVIDDLTSFHYELVGTYFENDAKIYFQLPVRKVTPILSNTFEQRFLLESEVRNGFKLEVTVYTQAFSRVVNFEAQVIWSDRNNPSQTIEIEGLALSCREKFRIWNEDEYNIKHYFNAPDSEGREAFFVVLDEERREWYDGQSMVFLGHNLCLPQDPNLLKHLLNNINLYTDMILKEGENLEDQPIDGNVNLWMDEDIPPLLSSEVTFTSPFNMDDLNPSNDIWGVGRVGFQGGGSAGHAEDFGLIKALDIIQNQSNEFFRRGRVASIMDAGRPVNHLETDGSMVRSADHPEWVTFVEYTDWRFSKDTLGKDRTGGRPALRGCDNQHITHNNLCSMVRFTGSELWIRTLDRFAETEIASHQYLSGARGLGRQFLFRTQATLYCTNFMALDRVNLDYLELMVKEAEEFGCNQGEAIRYQNVPSPAYLRVPNNDGVIQTGTDYWVPWGEAQAVAGIQAALNSPTLRARLTEDQATRLYNYNVKVAETVVKYGVFQDSGKWYQCYRLASNPNNDGLRPEFYRIGDPHIRITENLWIWVMPAIIYAANHSSDVTVVDKAERIMEHFGFPECPNLNQAENWHID